MYVLHFSIKILFSQLLVFFFLVVFCSCKRKYILKVKQVVKIEGISTSSR